jgi:hypothetical protein
VHLPIVDDGLIMKLSVLGVILRLEVKVLVVFVNNGDR